MAIHLQKLNNQIEKAKMITTIPKNTNTICQLDIDQQVIGVALAAGFGTRLKPLTDTTPKPLIQFCGAELILTVIQKLQKFGVKQIGINTHFLSEKISSFLAHEITAKKQNKLRIHLSNEKNQILGTGGCYTRFNEVRNSRAMITANGDVLSTTDLDDLFKFHKEQESIATMALLDKPHKTGSNVWIIGNFIVHIGPDNGGFNEATPHGFACFQVLEDRVLQYIDDEKYQELVPIYEKMIQSGERVCGYVHSADWFDLGTHDDYYNAHQYFLDKLVKKGNVIIGDEFGILNSLDLKGSKYEFINKGEVTNLGSITIEGPSFIIGQPKSDYPVHIGPNTVVMNDVKFSKQVNVSSSILTEGCIVNEDLTNALVHKDVVIPIS